MERQLESQHGAFLGFECSRRLAIAPYRRGCAPGAQVQKYRAGANGHHGGQHHCAPFSGYSTAACGDTLAMNTYEERKDARTRFCRH
jgi:hypothetical protein